MKKLLMFIALIAMLFCASLFGATAWQSQTPATASWTSSTAVGTAIDISVKDFATVSVSAQTSSITDGAIAFEASDDGAAWYLVTITNVFSATPELYSGLAGVGQTNASRLRLWQGSVAGYQRFRVRLLSAIVGSGTASLRLQASAGPSRPVTADAGYVDTNDGWSVLNMYLTKRNRASR